MQFYECVNKVHTPLSQLISHKLENSNELLKVSLIKNPPCRILFGELPFPVNIYQAPVSAPAEVCSSVKRDWKGFSRIENQDKQSMNYLTWAAGDFHGCQRPNNDHISLCNALWCCTLESRCCQALGSASARFPRNPRNRGCLFGTNQRISSDRQQITAQPGGSGGYSWEMMVYIFQIDILSPKPSRNEFGKGSFLGEMRHLLSASTTAGQLTGSKFKHFMEKSNLFILLGQIPKGNQPLYN